MSQEPSRLLTFQTDDPDYLCDSITAAPPSRTIIQKHGRSPFSARLHLMTGLPRLRSFKVSMSRARILVREPLGFYSITIALDAAFASVTRGQTDIVTPGAAHVAHADDPFDLRLGEGSEMLVLSIDKPFLHDYVRKLYAGDAPHTDRFGPRLSLATPQGAGYWRYLNFVWKECTRGPAIWSPLVMKEMEDTLVAMLVNALDDQRAETHPVETRGYPVYLRRAEDYIVAHLEAPVCLADLAEVAGVSAYTLSKAFHQRHGTSPMKFLKERRLEAARRALLEADPRSTTVTDMAMRFGFSHLGRFARDYRKAFQELPSETLRR